MKVSTAVGEEPVTAAAAGLRRFLVGEVPPWFEIRKVPGGGPRMRAHNSDHAAELVVTDVSRASAVSPGESNIKSARRP